MFFFFFFDELYNVSAIQQAFKNICLDKMLSDGYFDMSSYIFGRIKKDDIYAKLTSEKSKYALLYKSTYPTKDNASNLWRNLFPEQYSFLESAETGELTHIECVGIVNWVYRIMKNADERRKFTLELFSRIKELHNIERYDNVKEIVDLYDQHVCRYFDLNYSVANKGKKSEVMFLSDEAMYPTDEELSTHKISINIREVLNSDN